MDGVTLAHGPLEVAGDLIVHGDIGDGAVLSVAGNLVVEGMVEGASLTVGNHLVAKQGIRGKGKAVICAERLSTTFMEETKAEVEQQILANFIFNCDVDCKGSVVCKGTKGQIIGGCIKACTYVEAMTTGKETGLGARFVLKDADLSEPVDKYVMVHGDMLGNTTIEIDDRISNNLTGSNVEFHYSNDGIKSYTIGSYVKPEELVQDETSRLIVLVDDDPVVLKQEYSDLADTYMVAAITKPTDALAFVAKKKPDLLLLDYMMPELNGVELLEKIRKLPGCAGIPAFFLTGVTDRAVVAKCLSVYPQGYLLKPMNRESLLKTLGDYFDENP